MKNDLYKRPLKHKRIDPVSFAAITQDESAFQGYRVLKLRDMQFPFILEKESVIIDFGDHYTGYLHIELENGSDDHIADSPTNIAFTFGEMPIELMEEVEDSPNSLSIGWLQKDFKTVAFMPYQGSLERRYSFRYLKLQRVDSVRFPVKVKALYLDSVSAVDMADCKPVEIDDALLRRIDSMCVKTLKECEQDVFEDGPKRDRRLWIGDLRLQALVDYETFQNIDLIKRCIYLFAEHTNQLGLIAPCVFPDTAPYVDQWFYLDYCLCIVSCLYDYMENVQDLSLVEELYPVAMRQILYTDSVFDRQKKKIDAMFFIDHGNYDRSVAASGYYAYILRQMIGISRKLNKPCDELAAIVADCDSALLSYYDPDKALFVTSSGEISWHSQIWAALSGALDVETSQRLLNKTAEEDPQIKFSSPFMMHYYLEALYTNGMPEKALACIRDFWGGILAAGFDCCPECFQFGNERLSPYAHPALNSACHAWSCTPAYWIRRYYNR